MLSHCTETEGAGRYLLSIALYMDENVPRQITVGLRLRNVDVLPVQEDERAGAPDPQVLEQATKLQKVLFSRDDDLLALAHRRHYLFPSTAD